MLKGGELLHKRELFLRELFDRGAISPDSATDPEALREAIDVSDQDFRSLYILLHQAGLIFGAPYSVLCLTDLGLKKVEVIRKERTRKMHEIQRRILEAIVNIHGPSSQVIADTEIAEKLELDLQEVRDHLVLMKGKGYVKLTLFHGGNCVAIPTPQGRVALREPDYVPLDHLSRRNRIPDLIEIVKQQRPDIALDDIAATTREVSPALQNDSSEQLHSLQSSHTTHIDSVTGPVHTGTGDIHIHSASPQEAPSHAHVEFSYRLVEISSVLDEHLYELEVIVENQGSQAIKDFKLEFTFPNLDTIPRTWVVVAPMSGNAKCEPATQLVEVEPRDDEAVSFSREDYTIQVTCWSRGVLFPKDKVVLTEAIGLKYRIDKSVYANIESMPPLSWTLYADNMPPKQGKASLSELNNY